MRKGIVLAGGFTSGQLFGVRFEYAQPSPDGLEQGKVAAAYGEFMQQLKYDKVLKPHSSFIENTSKWLGQAV